MAKLLLKVKWKSGQILVNELNLSQNVTDLKNLLSTKCQISEECLNVLYGFPPKPLDLEDGKKILADCGLSSGDTLIIEEKAPELARSEQTNVPSVANPVSNKGTEDLIVPATSDYIEQIECRGLLLRQVVPADNSCLFTSIGFVLSGKIDLNCGSYMRQIIAEHVRSDSETYSEAMLGKPPLEYCDWILRSESWGGAIEISILSKYYGIEIAVVDTINAIINRFGEDQTYPSRVLLIFDGIHYDPLYLESPKNGNTQTLFPTSDNQILIDASLLAEESKASRQFTDVNKFTVKCLECNVMLKGQIEAQAHAEATRHVSFGEI